MPANALPRKQATNRSGLPCRRRIRMVRSGSGHKAASAAWRHPGTARADFALQIGIVKRPIGQSRSAGLATHGAEQLHPHQILAWNRRSGRQRRNVTCWMAFRRSGVRTR